jgi:hypothetical protein
MLKFVQRRCFNQREDLIYLTLKSIVLQTMLEPESEINIRRRMTWFGTRNKRIFNNYYSSASDQAKNRLEREIKKLLEIEIGNEISENQQRSYQKYDGGDRDRDPKRSLCVHRWHFRINALQLDQQGKRIERERAGDRRGSPLPGVSGVNARS